MTVAYTDPGFVISATHSPIDEYRMYGPKLRTRWMVRCADGRTRRVYGMQYGNAASVYVVVGGQDVFLSIEAESILGKVR